MRAVRARTTRPFAVNVFAPGTPSWTEGQLDQARVRLAPLRRELGLGPDPAPAGLTVPGPARFDEQVEVLLAAPPAAVSFTFGTLPTDAVAALHDVGCTLIGTATSTAEAAALAEGGTDIICAQGVEAGAHRGHFLTDSDHAMIGILVLVPLVVDAVELPVIAAGGIMDGRGIAAVLTLGASGAQLGTAFLRCPEAGTHPLHRRLLAQADETATVVTDAITGRAARAIDNRLIRELQGLEVPAYPAMHHLTAPLRTAGADADRGELTSVWAGQGVSLGTELPARELVDRVAADTRARLAAISPATWQEGPKMREPPPGWQQRVRDSLGRQQFIADTLDATIDTLEPGRIVLRMPCTPAVSQQHGYVHAGATASLADSACGYAAFSLAPADHTVLTAEFKINLLAPAQGQYLLADGHVLKAGRTLTVCNATVHAIDDATSTLVAAVQATVVLFPGDDA